MNENSTLKQNLDGEKQGQRKVYSGQGKSRNVYYLQPIIDALNLLILSWLIIQKFCCFSQN